jgi:nicotinamidase-related amidase
MTTGTRRDPRADHLITPENAALLVIDYQPSQVAAVRSMGHQLLLKNVVSTVKAAKAFGLPIVHATINVASGRQKPTVPELAEVLEGNAPIDRTSINSWEDADFVAAVRNTGRRKLILCALWTEVCMAFPVSWVSLACELQRDWARLETVPQVIQIVLTERVLQE